MILAKLMNPQKKITGGFSKPYGATDGRIQIQRDDGQITQLPCNQEAHGDDQWITQLPHNQEAHGNEQQITLLPHNQEAHGNDQQITQLPHNQEAHGNDLQITQLPRNQELHGDNQHITQLLHDQGAYGDDQQITQVPCNQGVGGDDQQFTQLPSNQGIYDDDLLITLAPQSSWIPEAEIRKIKDGSCSRKNFAKKLAEALFDEETRASSNVSGRGKRKLNPIIIKYVRSICFQFYPHHGDEVADWKECIRAINEGNRRLLRKKN